MALAEKFFPLTCSFTELIPVVKLVPSSHVKPSTKIKKSFGYNAITGCKSALSPSHTAVCHGDKIPAVGRGFSSLQAWGEVAVGVSHLPRSKDRSLSCRGYLVGLPSSSVCVVLGGCLRDPPTTNLPKPRFYFFQLSHWINIMNFKVSSVDIQVSELNKSCGGFVKLLLLGFSELIDPVNVACDLRHYPQIIQESDMKALACSAMETALIKIEQIQVHFEINISYIVPLVFPIYQSPQPWSHISGTFQISQAKIQIPRPENICPFRLISIFLFLVKLDMSRKFLNWNMFSVADFHDTMSEWLRSRPAKAVGLPARVRISLVSMPCFTSADATARSIDVLVTCSSGIGAMVFVLIRLFGQQESGGVILALPVVPGMPFSRGFVPRGASRLSHRIMAELESTEATETTLMARLDREDAEIEIRRRAETLEESPDWNRVVWKMKVKNQSKCSWERRRIKLNKKQRHHRQERSLILHDQLRKSQQARIEVMEFEFQRSETAEVINPEAPDHKKKIHFISNLPTTKPQKLIPPQMEPVKTNHIMKFFPLWAWKYYYVLFFFFHLPHFLKKDCQSNLRMIIQIHIVSLTLKDKDENPEDYPTTRAVFMALAEKFFPLTCSFTELIPVVCWCKLNKFDYVKHSALSPSHTAVCHGDKIPAVGRGFSSLQAWGEVAVGVSHLPRSKDRSLSCRGYLVGLPSSSVCVVLGGCLRDPPTTNLPKPRFYFFQLSHWINIMNFKVSSVDIQVSELNKSCGGFVKLLLLGFSELIDPVNVACDLRHYPQIIQESDMKALACSAMETALIKIEQIQVHFEINISYIVPLVFPIYQSPQPWSHISGTFQISQAKIQIPRPENICPFRLISIFLFLVKLDMSRKFLNWNMFSVADFHDTMSEWLRSRPAKAWLRSRPAKAVGLPARVRISLVSLRLASGLIVRRNSAAVRRSAAMTAGGCDGVVKSDWWRALNAPACRILFVEVDVICRRSRNLIDFVSIEEDARITIFMFQSASCSGESVYPFPSVPESLQQQANPPTATPGDITTCRSETLSQRNNCILTAQHFPKDSVSDNVTDKQ
ncbi:hypothetical protein VP01_314g3 [Puccinia sorghi]|uniref:Uncharacterized protein n=1 Tax=Puccinia sorghi TaxID=27349 RepID=A0A0L6UZQ6_9BASI|nr:hypothetical protein VP01_314g3 [Puccinia sorghi]